MINNFGSLITKSISAENIISDSNVEIGSNSSILFSKKLLINNFYIDDYINSILFDEPINIYKHCYIENTNAIDLPSGNLELKELHTSNITSTNSVNKEKLEHGMHIIATSNVDIITLGNVIIDNKLLTNYINENIKCKSNYNNNMISYYIHTDVNEKIDITNFGQYFTNTIKTNKLCSNICKTI